MKEKAKIVECRHEGGGYQDHCYECAPWWGKYPVCPQHRSKLTRTGYCKSCRQYYDISELDQKRLG